MRAPIKKQFGTGRNLEWCTRIYARARRKHSEIEGNKKGVYEAVDFSIRGFWKNVMREVDECASSSDLYLRFSRCRIKF